MNLLPKSSDEFGSSDYWEGFFKKRGDKSFEWYGEYNQLCGIIHKYVKVTDKILMVGCGNSDLSANMYDVGYKDLTSIDISDVAIRQMIQKNHSQRPDLQFIQMDMKQMEFRDDLYNVVVDKGTLDAILTDASEAVLWEVDKMFAEISRVLKVGGRYLCISLAQDHIINKLLTYFSKEGWPICVHRLDDESDVKPGEQFKLPVFVFILTKFRRMPNAPKIFEVAYTEDQVERVEALDDMKKSVKALQHYALVRHNLQNKNQSGKHLSVSLYSPTITAPRYTLYVVDGERSMNKFAIFIIPQGRENEWLFGTDMGRDHLSKTVNFERLLVVATHREHKYDNMEQIKSELSAKVMELAPRNPGKAKVPFLSIGDDIGRRTVKHEGNSIDTGDYVIEDVDVDSEVFRRLYFKNNPSTCQSEAKLVKAVVKKKRAKVFTKLIVDPTYLAFQIHVAMVAGLAFMEDFQKIIEEGLDISILGLGGGCLPRYLNTVYPKATIDIVEKDVAMLTVAEDWFGMKPSEFIRPNMCDALDYIERLTHEVGRKHIVMLDIDNKDTKSALVSPPILFMQKDFLKKVDSILHPQGLFIVNLSCQGDARLRSEIIANIRAVFKLVFNKQMVDESNEVIYAISSRRASCQDTLDENKLGKNLQRSVKILQDLIKTRSESGAQQALVTMMEGLEIL
ncbi:eEF1A lysine and N-terminal methyltransferase-like [Tubulanus polymorphus]|uniref:eEF1A lysine and N-terminal methyltransferase-like n=1 Tax=Tubulanus polymorphus TaxID=672921 RepID=UPI003DA29E9B